jgi:hypothetical protein
MGDAMQCMHTWVIYFWESRVFRWQQEQARMHGS